MPFDYGKLWLYLEREGMTKDDLRIMIRSSPNTMVKLSNNESVPLDVIDRICKGLGRTPNDIMDYIPDETPVYDVPQIRRGDILLRERKGASKKAPHEEEDYQESAMSTARPYLIYQNDDFIEDGVNATVMAIPFTSIIRLIMPNTHVTIRPDGFNNLTKTSALMVEGMRAFPRADLWRCAKAPFGRVLRRV